MARNSSGVYQVPPETYGVPNSVIRSDRYNAFLNDIGAEVTASLPRDGRARMTGPLGLSDQGVNFGSSPTSGINYDVARGGIAVAINGVEAMFLKGDSVTVNNLTSQNVVRPGTVLTFAGPTPPLGTLICGGQAVSRAAYPALLATIGLIYGAGDGSTTFNIPDFRGLVVAGLDNMGGSDAGRMLSFGAQRVTLGGAGGVDQTPIQISQLPPHDHGGAVTPDLGHSHPVVSRQLSGYAGQSPGVDGVVVVGNEADFNFVGSTRVGGAHGHGIPTQGGGLPLNICQPTRFANICIQT